ncbi:hypothetical protein K431DRAFT_233998 [Polychaeton citri CBS 116435]|uniref:C2 NT-type domain-containing protein n=1 Tax=Polychaeton citri CBS 116435 TaxID=1314669 RepID=A0A9P4Q224_9PEZI|nr:hypothetical protein K431DRAFT_233998 [Polychaeton citri CBS 116435]
MAFVSKSRRAKFEFHLTVFDLNNVPLVSGSSFIKWHLPTSTSAEHRGRTPKSQIRDHKVQYQYEKSTVVRLSVGRDGVLQECAIEFEVLQEYSSGGRAERIKLGEIRLNLAEYVEASEARAVEEGVIRRYLMQDSKINSTLKIGIHMRYLEGTRDYIAPPLRTAPVFGGIAGIIHSSEPAEDNHLPVPTLSSTNKEVGEMQDMYRRTLAAYWSSQPGELKADECIEDIFAGGDGWGKLGRPRSSHDKHAGNIHSDSTPNPDTDADNGNARFGRKHLRIHNHDESSNGDGWRSGALKQGAINDRSSAGMRFNQYRGKGVSSPRKRAGEVDEFDVREDLRSWRVGEAAY